MKIRYSPDARDKLGQIKKDSGVNVVGKVMKTVKGLTSNPRRCPTVENMLGIPSPYYFLHVEHFYAFYRIEEDAIYVTDIYNEREDFLWKMFGIKLRTDESIEYWGE